MDAPTVTSFVRDANAFPSVDALIPEYDPDVLSEQYRLAGFDKLADRRSTDRRREEAHRYYDEVDLDTYRAIFSFLNYHVEIKDCVQPPPQTALAISMTAKEREVFDSIMVISRYSNEESILVGVIGRNNEVQHYFFLAYWSRVGRTYETLLNRTRWRNFRDGLPTPDHNIQTAAWGMIIHLMPVITYWITGSWAWGLSPLIVCLGLWVVYTHKHTVGYTRFVDIYATVATGISIVLMFLLGFGVL